MAYNPHMLKLAREYRGYTQSELSAEMRMAQGTISKIEKGILVFDEEIALNAADILELPIRFFEDEEVIIPIEGEYRRKLSGSVREFNSNVAKMTISERHLLKLIDAIDVPHSNLPTWDVTYDGSPSMCAKSLRKKWRLDRGRISNITELVEANGVIIIPLSLESMDGFSTFTKNGLPLIFVNRNIPADRYRFTIAHEIGHLIMHIPFVIPEDSDTEAETNEFASEFLMPEHEIKPQLIGLNFSMLLNLKRYWKVSMQSIIYRAKTLGVLTVNQQKYLWSQIGSAGYKKSEPVVFDHEQPTSIKEILQVYMEDLGYTMNDLAKILNMHPVELKSIYLNNMNARLKVIKQPF